MRTTPHSIFKILSFVALIFTLLNCSTSDGIISNGNIQKRKYNKGWHIPKHKINTTKDLAQSEKADKNKKLVKEETTVSHNYLADELVKDLADLTVFEQEDINGNLSPNNQITREETLNTREEKCDQIILKNGDEITAKVLEVGIKEIKYKMCDNLDGPTFVKALSDVFMIKYSNGTKTVLNDKSAEKEEVQEEKKEIDYVDTINIDDKSFYVAVGLWFFL